MRSFPSFFATAAAIAMTAAPSVAALPYFSEVFPNTADDANLEYFSIRNPACEPLSLSGYSVVDASGRAFPLSSGAVLEAHSFREFLRPETKITLNNDNETLSLFDPFGKLVDYYAYATSSKGVPIVRSGFSDVACVPADSGTGSASAVSTSSGTTSESSVSTGTSADSTADPVTVSWSSASPQISPDLQTPPDPSDSGMADSEGVLITGAPSSEPFPPDSGVVETPPPNETVPSESIPGVTESGSDQNSVDVPQSQDPLPPTSSWVSDSAVQSTPGTSPTPSVSRAVAEYLTIVDVDGDGRFDYADVRYSENLSGTADPSEYYLYSNTGGLYANRVATLTGYFSRAEIRWPVLRLAFSGTTLPKTAMRADSSTSSEFRIKNLSTAALRTLSSGLPTVALTLTTSFSGYSADRIDFLPPFPEDVAWESGSVSQGSPTVSVPTSTAPTNPLSTTSVSASGITVPKATVSKTATGKTVSPKAVSVKSTTKKPSAESAFPKNEIPIPDGFFVVPSAGVDLLSNGKYRFECFSTSCPVSFKVEWPPSGSRGYWFFPDGRKRYGTSTSTLGKNVPASYRLSYVLETSEWTAKIPLSLSVVSELPDAKTSTTATKATKTLGSQTSSGSSKTLAKVSKTPAAKPSVKTVPASASKASSSKTGASLERSGTVGTSSTGVVSAAVAALFLGLFGGIWFSGHFRSPIQVDAP